MIQKLRAVALILVVAVLAVLASSPAMRAYAQSLAGYYLTNGQILIGSTGSAPVAATLTGSTAVSVSNGAGTITLDLNAAGIGTAKIAANVIDTSKLNFVTPANVNSGKILCAMGGNNQQLGVCSGGITGASCTCN